MTEVLTGEGNVEMDTVASWRLGSDKIAEALSKVQYPTIRKTKTVSVRTKTGGTYEFSYAPLESIIDAIRGPLAEQGLVLTQNIFNDKCITRILHSSGQIIRSCVPVHIGPNDSPQEIGSKITYARRYGVTLVCCLAADDDDDGNIAEGNTAIETPKKPIKKPIKATTGAGDGLDKESKEKLDELAKHVKMDLDIDQNAAAAAARIDFEIGDDVDPEHKTYLWSLLNSKHRKAIKEAIDARKAKDKG
jgi:hypothetical protein